MHSPDVYPVRVCDLIVDPSVQRQADRRRINKIAGDFNPDAVGIITVSHRTNGDMHIIDGQHRVQALRAAGHEKEEVLCRVFKGLSLAEEATMFRLLNTSVKVAALDHFRVRLVEGDPVAKDMIAILGRYGWEIKGGAVQGGFQALAAFERVYRLDRNAAEKAIAAVTYAWGHDAVSVDGRLVEGIGLVLARHGDAIDMQDLTDKLAKFPGGAAGMIGGARGMRNVLGGKVANTVAEIVVETYNGSRRTTRLPSWRAT